MSVADDLDLIVWVDDIPVLTNPDYFEEKNPC